MLSEKLRRFGRSFRNVWLCLRGIGPATETSVDEMDRRGAIPRAIVPADLAVLQSLGRLQAIEPFEGWQHLEAVRATMNSLERGLDWVVDRGRGLRDQFERRGVMQKARDQWRRIVGGGGGDQKSGAAANEPGALRRRFDRGYRDAGEWLRTSGMQSLQKALGSLLAHDPAQWVRKRAAKILQRRDLEDVTDAAQALDAMRKLKPDERERLLVELYPYDLPGLSRYMKALDVTVNLGLGAVVATNLPGTGALVSLVNMIKTIFKIAHRLHLMSAVYGYGVRDANSLFTVSAKILQSLQGWESDVDHRPLAFDVLNELYDPPGDATGERGLPALLNASLKKDAYISLPGVGMVGLGKIGLDDARLDQSVRTLVAGYFARREQLDRYGAQAVNRTVAEFAEIYAAFHRRDYFREMRRRRKSHARVVSEQTPSKEIASNESTTQVAASESRLVRDYLRGIYARVSRSYTAFAVDEYFESLSKELDRHAADIFARLHSERERQPNRIRDTDGPISTPRWNRHDADVLRAVDEVFSA